MRPPNFEPPQIRDEWKLISEAKVCEMLGIHRSTLWRWITDGRFAKPVKVGLSSNRWFVQHVKEFMRRSNDERYSIGNYFARYFRSEYHKHCSLLDDDEER